MSIISAGRIIHSRQSIGLLPYFVRPDIDFLASVLQRLTRVETHNNYPDSYFDPPPRIRNDTKEREKSEKLLTSFPAM